MIQNDTICALATAPGGAIGIIRISGDQAISCINRIFSSDLMKAQANSILYGHIIDLKDELVDEVLVSVFRAPHSYTGEDCIEISCHGSTYILNKVLELLISKGCRMATPGEFTMRAYLNGKLDLSQAEAVADLIAANNEATHKLAISQLRGHLSTKLSELREQLLHLTTLLELELDFSDHEDLEFADRTELKVLTNNIKEHIEKLICSFEKGQALKNGINVAIIGKTNVGKSTLLNKLLKDERAIVSDIHGTTRDTIEDVIQIGGIAFRLIDTAGLRSTEDTIERIGIERTYNTISKAQIVIWITDDVPSNDEREKIKLLTEGKPLIEVHNKTDLTGGNIGKENNIINISAKHGEGIDILEQTLLEFADISSLHESDVIVTNARHYDALTRAHESLQHVLKGMQNNLSGDLLAEDLRHTLSHLAEITGGQITTDEVLGNIFKNFCVGK